MDIGLCCRCRYESDEVSTNLSDLQWIYVVIFPGNRSNRMNRTSCVACKSCLSLFSSQSSSSSSPPSSSTTTTNNNNNIFISYIKYTNITPPANSKANRGRWCVDGLRFITKSWSEKEPNFHRATKVASALYAHMRTSSSSLLLFIHLSSRTERFLKLLFFICVSLITRVCCPNVAQGKCESFAERISFKWTWVFQQSYSTIRDLSTESLTKT